MTSTAPPAGIGTDDTTLLSRLQTGSDSIRAEMKRAGKDLDPATLLKGYDPQDDPKRTSKPPHAESAEDKKLDQLRGAVCSEMMAFYVAKPWNDLCGDRILSKDYAFGRATTGAEDLVPFCGREAARECGQGMGTAPRVDSGTSGSAEAIMDCDMVSWRAACLLGTKQFDADPQDAGYGERLYGLIPPECYCACYDQCTMGQTGVLAQRTGATCSAADLRAGRCREPA